MKKLWEKPKLIVLVRTTPEESLILWCKGNGLGTMPTTVFTGCYTLDVTLCLPCVQFGAS